jgi:hypothetical protein
MDKGSIVSVAGHGGIAFYVVGPEEIPDEDTEWSGYLQPTGRIICVMVGDDHRWTFDPEDLTILPEDGYCRDCGSTRCFHGR